METNAVMLDFSRHKAGLVPLSPPVAFTMTAAGVAPFAGGVLHERKVRGWARATWEDWRAHHVYVRRWMAEHSAS